jgi:serine/threonine protein kinase
VFPHGKTPRSRAELQRHSLVQMRLPHPTDSSLCWKLLKLSKGQAADIYLGVLEAASCTALTSLPSSSPMAIKMHRAPSATSLHTLSREARYLSHLQDTGVVPRLICIGGGVDVSPFLVMELLATDVSQLRAKMTDVALWRLFLAMFDTLHAVHGAGVLHRDIKPSNFAVAWTRSSSSWIPWSDPVSSTSSPQTSPVACYLIDLEMAEMARDEAGAPRCVRECVGKTKYRSRAQHKGTEQWFGDDLVMLAYTFIELLHGLPWDTNDNNRCSGASKDARVLQAKKEYTCPNEALNRMLRCLEALQPGQVPPYSQVRKLLSEEVGRVERRKQGSGNMGRTLEQCVAEAVADQRKRLRQCR